MTDRSQAEISVIVCAYTEARWDDLRAAVVSLHAQTLPPREIVVVIDHHPALLERVRQEIPGVIAVENRGPRGLSGARNTGISLALGPVIAFMDEDAVAAPDWLATLAAGYADPSVLGVGGAIEPWWLTARPAWFPAEFDWVVGCTYRGMPTGPARLRNLIGCNMSFRREVFAAVGGFQPGIGRVGTVPVGCEETELCIRAGQHWRGRFFLYRPDARVRHRVPAARARFAYFRSRCYGEGRSKALVASLVGSQDGLASERGYALRTLPRGVLRGLADAVVRRDVGGLGRSAAIVAGLLLTTWGYLTGSLMSWRQARRDRKAVRDEARLPGERGSR